MVRRNFGVVPSAASNRGVGVRHQIFQAVVTRGGQVAQDSRGVFELNRRQELAIGTRITGQLFFVKGLRGVEDLFWRVAE